MNFIRWVREDCALQQVEAALRGVVVVQDTNGLVASQRGSYFFAIKYKNA